MGTFLIAPRDVTRRLRLGRNHDLEHTINVCSGLRNQPWCKQQRNLLKEEPVQTTDCQHLATQFWRTFQRDQRTSDRYQIQVNRTIVILPSPRREETIIASVVAVRPQHRCREKARAGRRVAKSRTPHGQGGEMSWRAQIGRHEPAPSGPMLAQARTTTATAAGTGYVGCPTSTSTGRRAIESCATAAGARRTPSPGGTLPRGHLAREDPARPAGREGGSHERASTPRPRIS